MNVLIQSHKLLAAMARKGWNLRDTYVNCGLDNRTLNKILAGEMPARIDAFYRLCRGLGVEVEDVLLSVQPHEKRRAEIRVIR